MITKPTPGESDEKFCCLIGANDNTLHITIRTEIIPWWEVREGNHRSNYKTHGTFTVGNMYI